MTDPQKESTQTPVSFQVTKWCILRLLGGVYFAVFLAAYFQTPGLLGSHGLSPVEDVISKLRGTLPLEEQGLKHKGFLKHPTLFWVLPPSDDNLEKITVYGLILSTVVMLGLNSWLAMTLLWLLHFSIVTVASYSGSFYNYGWESQLLETTFLAIFLCDFPHMVKITTNHTVKENYVTRSVWRLRGVWRDGTLTEPSRIILFLMQWLIFRISIGAGLIKIRGSSCWTEKTCLWYHFETQPVPSPLSFFFHFLPKWILSSAVDLDIFVQLKTVWLVLIPPCRSTILMWLRRSGGMLQIGFMVMIMASGNFSILNHLTIVPAFACLDDEILSFCARSLNRMRDNLIHPKLTVVPQNFTVSSIIRCFLNMAVFGIVSSLSIPVVKNLLQWNGTHQQMNASYDPFRLVNTYGAFGSVGTLRYEPIISISYDESGHTWHEIEFPCKPGSLTRRPCFCAPYHYRLDWNIWFLGFKPHQAYLRQRETWLYALVYKMMEPVNSSDAAVQLKERPWLSLLDSSAIEFFPPYSSKIPKAVKVEMFNYRMANSLWPIFVELLLEDRVREVTWWERVFEETLIPPVKLDSRRKQLVLV